MWVGKTPNEDTPPGATYQFNRAVVLKDARVRAIGVAEDNLNPGEFVVCLFMVKEDTGEEFAISAWNDEERTRPGWLHIAPARGSVCD
jgi:hypothetical protein